MTAHVFKLSYHCVVSPTRPECFWLNVSIFYKVGDICQLTLVWLQTKWAYSAWILKLLAEFL